MLVPLNGIKPKTIARNDTGTPQANERTAPNTKGDKPLLSRTGEKWEFESELVLENFVWSNLRRFFGLTPLKQQHRSNGECCDILAVDAEDALIIIELKNTEDRYIVQQLTRYYHNLLEEKPFQPQVNYEHSAGLVAIAPSFHRHNLIDRIYSQLDIHFWRFEILQVECQFYLLLEDIDTSETLKYEIPYREVNYFRSRRNLPAPPKVLLEHLGGCAEDEQQAVLSLRERLLSFDSRMKEETTAKSIQYGTGKTKLCAELFFNKKKSELVLFLWIPLWRYRKEALGRHRIWTDWHQVLYFGHAPEGLGKRMPVSHWNSIPREKWPRQFSSMSDYEADNFSERLAMRIGCKDTSLSLVSLLDLALEKWLAKLSR